MSNFSSIKNMPRLFQKPSVEKVWQTLKDPYAIAIFASVGVHGLLGVGLPLISSSTPKSPDDYRTLNVVELSPLEQQARLPQTSVPQPAPDVISPNSTSANSGQSTIPVVPLDESVPDTSNSYQIPGLSSSTSLNSSPTTTPDTSTSIQTPATTPPATSTPPKPKDSTTAKKQESQPQVDADESTTVEPNENPDRPSTRADDLKPIEKSSASNPDTANKVALQTLYAFNATGTTLQDFEANATIAATKILEKHNVEQWEKNIKARAPYPKEACQFQHEGKPVSGTTGLAVVMQPDGSLSEGTMITRSSGFKGLDETARKFVETQWNEIAKQNGVNVSNRAKAFPIEVMVKPADGECGAATTTKPAS